MWSYNIIPFNIVYITAYFNVLTELVDINREWIELGIALDLKYHILDEIEANHVKDGVKRCLQEVIHSWFEGNGSELSWEVLCAALRSDLISRPVIAEDIESKFNM